MHNYKELKVWRKAMDFVVAVYSLTKRFPKDELFGLTSQLRRAATSVPLNIAESAGCDSDQEFARFLDIALRSGYESIVALQIAKQLNYDGIKELDGRIEQAEEIAHAHWPYQALRAKPQVLAGPLTVDNRLSTND